MWVNSDGSESVGHAGAASPRPVLAGWRTPQSREIFPRALNARGFSQREKHHLVEAVALRQVRPRRAGICSPETKQLLAG